MSIALFSSPGSGPLVPSRCKHQTANIQDGVPKPKVWLVTGCSSGLGRELVIALLACGDKVIPTARKISDLDYLYHLHGAAERAHPLELDVTMAQSRLMSKIDEATSRLSAVDVLVNNAGFVLSGVWEETK